MMSSVLTKECNILLVGGGGSGKRELLREVGHYLGAENAVHPIGNIKETLVSGYCPLHFASNYGSIKFNVNVVKCLGGLYKSK